jgi:uncharacterized membrane protein
MSATTYSDTTIQAIPSTAISTRVQAVDILRGAVMVLMAIDHVRVYSGLPPGGPEAGIFFTRWITHFCAPAFVFLAGTSAFLYGNKLNDKNALARYLLSRGVLLVILELTLIRFFWTFSVDYSDFLLAGVIWMLGWCMIMLAAFVYLKPLTLAIAGLIIILIQPLFAKVPELLPASVANFWEFIYPSGLESPGGVTVLYVLVPWAGVMAAGYGFGKLLLLEEQRRKRMCYWIGLSSIGIFLLVGTIMILQQEPQEGAPPFIFQLLNQRKYPASPLYLMMTLGPVIALIPFAEKARGWFANVLTIFGKVPMFYYLMHILIIHISALAVNRISGVEDTGWYVHAPYTFVTPELRWSLPLLYVVFVADVILLYFACRWYVQYKFSHRENKWLRYL